MLNVSRDSIIQATKVLKSKDDELIKEVETGKISVHAATKEIDLTDKYPEIKSVVFNPSDQRIIAQNLDRMDAAQPLMFVASSAKAYPKPYLTIYYM